MAPQRAIWLLAVVLLVPLVAASPIAATGAGGILVTWFHLGKWGECREPVWVSYERVNARLLVEIQTGARQLGTTTSPNLNAQCPTPVIVAAGAFNNPCELLRNSIAAPTVNTVDPYFYEQSRGTWTKTVAFPEGTVSHQLDEPDNYGGLINGDCRAGDTYAWWFGSFQGATFAYE